MKWLNVEIGKVADVASGFGFPREHQGTTGGEFPFFKVGDMNLPGNERHMTNIVNTISAATLKKLKAKAFPKGTIIFPKIGAAIATNKKRMLTQPSVVDNNVMVLIPTPHIDAYYLYYWMLQFDLRSVTNIGPVPSMRKSEVQRVPIPLPPLSEQRRIVEILDQATALRRKRAEADAKAARILPALFYKMFGDPLANPHGFPMETVGNLLSLLRNGTTEEQNQDGHGYPVTRIETISAGVINPVRVRYVDFDDSELKKWRLEPGDILFSHINSESHIGKTAIYKGQPDPLIHGMNLLLMRPDARQIWPEYLFAVLNTDSVRAAYRQRCKRAVNQASLNQKDISSLEVAVPPIDAQDRFCLLAGNLLQQVETQQKTTENIEKLFDNLIHRAFTSDLTAKWREAHMKELLQEMEQQAKSLNLRMES